MLPKPNLNVDTVVADKLPSHYKQHYWDGGTSSIIIRDTEFHPV